MNEKSSNFNKSILVAGAGSIGTVTGLLLNRAGFSVELLRRNGDSGIQKVSIIGLEKFYADLIIHISSKLSNSGKKEKKLSKISADIIFITVQAQQTKSIINFILNHCEVKESTIIVTLQNGLVAPSLIIYEFQHKFKNAPNLIQGVVWWSATLINNSTVLYHNQGPTYLGVPNKSSASTNHLNTIHEILNQVLDVKKSDNINNEARKKLILNVVSPVLALVKKPYPLGLNNSNIRKLIHILFDEALEIAIRENWEINDERLIKFHSMLKDQDIKKQGEKYSISNSSEIHKVSTQISAEKHGGELSNVNELLGFFIDKGGKFCEIIMNEVVKLPKNYAPIEDIEIENIISQDNVKTCKFDNSFDNQKFVYE